jgi:DNA-binding HxlR family transcriptional regulator
MIRYRYRRQNTLLLPRMLVQQLSNIHECVIVFNQAKKPGNALRFSDLRIDFTITPKMLVRMVNTNHSAHSK